MVWIADANGQNIHVNPAWTDYTGLTREQSRGFGWMLAIHPLDINAIQERFWAASPIGAPFELEARIRSASGEYGIFRGLTFAHGDTWVGYCHAADLSERGEDRFRMLTDTLPLLVWAADRDDRLTFVNRTWVDYTGLKVGSTIEERNALVHPDDLDGLLCALRSGRADVEFRLRRRSDQMYRWHLLRWVRLPVANEELPFTRVGTAMDIHELREPKK